MAVLAGLLILAAILIAAALAVLGTIAAAAEILDFRGETSLSAPRSLRDGARRACSDRRRRARNADQAPAPECQNRIPARIGMKSQ